MIKHISLTLLSLFLLWQHASAQPRLKMDTFQPGSIEEQLQETEYPHNPSASAAYLFDWQETEWQALSNGFRLNSHRWFRIKIYKAEGLDYATVTIPFYKPGIGMPIKKIEAVTYNLNAQGRTIKNKLSPREIITNHVYGKYYELVILFPQAKVGSVLELRYKHTSDEVTHMPDFEVQADIPKATTHYHTEIPNFFNYTLAPQGNLEYDTYDIRIKDNIQEFFGGYYFHRYLVDLEANQVPPFEEEPYMPVENRSRAKVVMQFSEYNIPGRHDVRNLRSWGGFFAILTGSESWQNTYGAINNVPVARQAEKTLAGAQEVYEWVQDNYAWDGRYSIYPDHKLKDFDGSKPGNIADINMTLWKALRKAGYRAQLCVGSARKYGSINRSVPVLSEFNHVLVRLELEGQAYFLNAGPPDLPFGALHAQDLNPYVVLLTGSDSHPISVYEKRRAEWIYRGSLTWNEDNMAFDGSYNLIKRDLARGLTVSQENLENSWRLNDLYSINISGADSLHLFSGQYPVDEAGNLLLVPLSVATRLTESPFTNESRQYPIDFQYPRRYSYITTVTIPEGYEIETLPDSATYTYGGNLLASSFRIEQEENKLTIHSELEINHYLFTPSNYAEVREFFEQVIQKHRESLVLVANE